LDHPVYYILHRDLERRHRPIGIFPQFLILWTFEAINTESRGGASPQWLFCKTGTMGTLASQAEIDVRSMHRGASTGIRGVWPPGKIVRLYMQNPAKFLGENFHDAVHNEFSNTSRMETAFPRVTPWNDPGWSQWDNNNNNNNLDDIYSAVIYIASHMREFTVVHLGQSRPAPGGRQLAGQAANLTFESACRLLEAEHSPIATGIITQP